MRSRPCKVLNDLYILAQDVDPVSRARVTAALVYKNKIIAYGTNQRKTHPMAAKFSKHEEAKSLHAEVACLRNAINRYGIEFIKKCTLYVARAKQTSDGDFVHGLAKPCSGCDKAIKTFGIKTVYYTTEDPNHYGVGKY